MHWLRSVLVGASGALLALTVGCGGDDGGRGSPDGGMASPDAAMVMDDAAIDGGLDATEPCVPSSDVCDGIDNDCDPSTPDGAEDPELGADCDGPDADSCIEGTMACEDGALVCSDSTAATLELCNGVDDDCNPATADGADEATVGMACDGDDTDLCEEGTIRCMDGDLACTDATGDRVELCNGVDDDCDPATADGAAEPTLGDPCDGSDGDLCNEGVIACTGTTLSCTDATATNADLCDGLDNDCNVATADGSSEPTLGDACDGSDGDLCAEGTISCTPGGLACSDTTTSNVELCNGVDDDCDPSTADGSGEPTLGNACDGADDDLCIEGTIVCGSAGLACNDTTASAAELCDGVNNDCDPSTADGADEPTLGDACDGSDSDLCAEGVVACMPGGLSCTDTTGGAVDVCDGVDNDCNPATADGSGESPPFCGGCASGAIACVVGAWRCTATVVTTGPASPSTGADLAGIGTEVWQSTGNIFASDATGSSTGQRAYVSAMTSGEVSRYLVAGGFGFAIPPGGLVTGIEAHVERRALSGIGIVDESVRLVRAGTVGSSNRSIGGVWSTTDAIQDYGGATDLWGATWAPADVNDPGFGVALAVRYSSTAGNDWPLVDHVQMTVHYMPSCP